MAGGFLTTHILDTANGCPAKGVKIRLHSISDAGERTELNECITNDDGRTDSPIIAHGELKTGEYELEFFIGDYFAKRGQGDKVRFLDVVPIRFGINEPDEHYHVPLLASPYSFSTYRGS